MKINKMIRIILILTISFYSCQICISGSNRNNQSNEIVFVLGVDNYVFSFKNQKISITKESSSIVPFKLNNNTYVGCDYENGKIGYKKYDVSKKISIKNDQLFYDDHLVILPENVKMRKFWHQAILWHNTVILLGRTSLTDKSANSIPPFFASELIYFNVKDLKAEIKWVDFEPPDIDIGIQVLQPMK
jgi:hypothetical protein